MEPSGELTAEPRHAETFACLICGDSPILAPDKGVGRAYVYRHSDSLSGEGHGKLTFAYSIHGATIGN